MRRRSDPGVELPLLEMPKAARRRISQRRPRPHFGDFKWLQGEELVRFYQSSPGFSRGFCGACGSPIITKSSHPEFGVPLGILDDDPNLRPTLHCFVVSKAPWFEITDTLPRIPELPDSY